MKLIEIVELASVFTNRTRLIDTGIFLQTSHTPLVSDVYNSNTDLSKIINCANLILKEIATDYLPLKFSQEITSTDGVIFYSQLLKNIFEPISVSINNKAVPFKVFSDSIKTSPGCVTLEYLFIPSNKDLFDTVECDSKLTNRLIAYGVACEFFTQMGIYDEAKLFEKRYKEGLLASSRYRRSQNIPAMRWV